MYETIIIGAGISGMTAAIYASRKRMDFLLITKDIGGQFLVSGEVLNYPGIVKTTGIEFKLKMEEQLKFNNVRITDNEEVKRIERIADGNFNVVTTKAEYETKTVIIASGARARKLNVKGEERLANNGLTYCAICDGPLFKDKDVAVIGGGDSALEAADFLLNIASKIYLINLTDRLTAHEYLQESIQDQPKVTLINRAKTTEILGDTKVTGIRYEQDGERKQLDVQGVFVEIGRVPNTEFVEGLVELDQHKHIVIDCQGNTSIPGIYAAGDCASGHEYQFVIAAGQGCMALLKAARYLARKKGQK